MTEQITHTDVEFSPEIGEFAKALPKAQAAMGEVFKTATNPAFRSKYAQLADVVAAVMPALNANGFSLMQHPGFRDGKVRVTTILLHESGQWARSTLEMQPTKADPQGVGSATTYARRYSLQAVTGVAPEDDDGNAASGPKRNGNGEPISAEQLRELDAMIEQAGAAVPAFLAYLKVSSLHELPAARFADAKAALAAKIAQKEQAGE